ncbi:MAG: DUF86 domain-containing protein [Campylobacteraceae bacterium]|nr:DUF86 domain-containing protein [Campylobacteraceae bacterium]
MCKEDELLRLKSIKSKIDDIYTIIDRHGSIVSCLNDIEGQPAILMLLVAVSEQFSKLHNKNSELLANFQKDDIKGLISVRNFIAHDYDGINLTIIEDDLRYNMPKILETINTTLN